MIETPVSVAELRKQFPFPWNYQQFSNGLIRVNDARGVEVPLPSMIGFLVTVTAIMGNQPTEKP